MKKTIYFLLIILCLISNAYAEVVTSILFEEFNTFREDIWGKYLYGFDGNGCFITPDAMQIDQSKLILTIDKLNPKINNKKYIGGGIETNAFFEVNHRFTARMINDITPGTVSGFFLMNQWQAQDWDHREIDIEFLGKDTTKIQLKVHHFFDNGKKHIYYSKTLDLGFDSSQDYHDYIIEWKPNIVNWYVDERLIYSETRLVPDVPLSIHMNYWLSDEEDPSFLEWLGPIDDYKLPSQVMVDFIRVEKILRDI
jgi:endoglucanase